MSAGFIQPEWMQAQDGAACRSGVDLRCAISGRGMLQVTGADAAEFLHAQFSSDMRELAPGRLRLSSYSDARGRLLAVMPVLADETGFLLELPADRLEPVAAQLRRFVLRAKVEIEDVSPNRAAFGLAGPSMASMLARRLERSPPSPGEWVPLESGAHLVGITPGARRWLAFGAAERLHDLWQGFDDLATAGPGCWDLLDIEAGIPSVYEQTAARFVAQMVNLDCLDAVDFRKGCYPGQEVIARTHYLGRVKRRMFPLHAPSAGALPAAGESVVDRDTGDAVGEVVRAARHPDRGVVCLAVLRLDAAEASLVLGDGSAATRLDPPYPLEQAA